MQPSRDGHPKSPALQELRVELLAEIAVGSTARVELCRVKDAERRLCAVKRLHMHVAEDPAFVDMFRDEVWMTAALKNRHVVEVLGWGNDRQGPWLAVELVRGVSLARLMKTVFDTGEMFTERMVVFLARCICEGLAEAHSLRSADGEHLNLVHRDLTPHNVLIGFAGEVKITDFGLAKAKQRLTRTLTGLCRGNPQYMSPEQVHNIELDGRSDIFALGVLLFELFSGRRPWAAGSDLDVMRAISEERAADLMELRPRMDRALVEIVERCLAKDRDQRFQSAYDLLERFDNWLSTHGYREANESALGRFVRRNAMRQMRWFERAVAGELAAQAQADQATVALYRLDAARAEDALGEDRDTVLDSRDPSQYQDIDWGEEAPTLIQRSQLEVHERSQPPPAAVPSEKARPLPGGEDEPPDADATVQLGAAGSLRGSVTGTAGSLRGRPGVVAPEDPDVPPIPLMFGAGPDGTEQVGSVTTTVPRAAPADPPSPGEDSSLLRTLPALKARTGPDGTALTVPLPVAPAPQGGAAIAAAPAAGMSEAAPERSSDFRAESQRLASAAGLASQRAQHAVEMAAAAARAYRLADQAALLGARGLRGAAHERIAEAQRIDRLLAQGELPQPRPLASDRLAASVDPWLARRVAFVKRQLQPKRIATIAVVAAAVLLLLVAVIAAFV